MPTPEHSQDLDRVLRKEIADRGPISFARFMERCLYHPTLGYYSRGLGGGGGRDYVTSSSLHGAFGALMARQAEDMWRGAGSPATFRFVEFGPGEGTFACDFLSAASGMTGFARALEYVLVEPSPGLRERQRARLSRLARALAGPREPRWEDLETLESAGIPDGCLFANEVLDAFPVHRVVGTKEGPREIHVAVREEALLETLLPLSDGRIAAFLDESGLALEDGQEVDVSLEAPRFASRMAGLLGRGYVLIVDYGYEAKDLYHPARRRGTLLAYHRHRTSEDFLARPGEQDLTAHVDFTAIVRAARQAGMRVVGRTSQARFLLALGALEFLEDASLPEREALKDMVLPDRMGGVFRVLVLAKGDVPDSIRGLSAPWEVVPVPANPGSLRDTPQARE
jgi:SAM-dependent MidA family methyltransferase